MEHSLRGFPSCSHVKHAYFVKNRVPVEVKPPKSVARPLTSHPYYAETELFIGVRLPKLSPMEIAPVVLVMTSSPRRADYYHPKFFSVSCRRRGGAVDNTLRIGKGVILLASFYETAMFSFGRSSSVQACPVCTKIHQSLYHSFFGSLWEERTRSNFCRVSTALSIPR